MEIWKDILGYEGYYQISSYGRIKSVERKVVKKMFGNTRIVKSKICTVLYSKQGYCRVRLSKEGKNIKYLIHRLVALAFIPNPENKPQVNHKDGNKSKNHKNNLEWATRSENMQHASKILKKVFGKNEKGKNWYSANGIANPASKKVNMFDKNGNLLGEYNSAWEAEEKNGLTHGMVSQYCNGKRNNKLYNFKYDI